MAIKVTKFSEGTTNGFSGQAYMKAEEIQALVKVKVEGLLKEKGDSLQVSDLVHEIREEKKMTLGISNRDLWTFIVQEYGKQGSGFMIRREFEAAKMRTLTKLVKA